MLIEVEEAAATEAGSTHHSQVATRTRYAVDAECCERRKALLLSLSPGCQSSSLWALAIYPLSVP